MVYATFVFTVCLYYSYSFFPIDVGTDFSISSLSCVNYTVEFSWHVQLHVADTLLQLTCHETHVRGSVYYLRAGLVRLS